MGIKPTPVTRQDAIEMAHGSYRGQKLCECCGERTADADFEGDRLCTPCIRDLTQSRGR